METISVSRKLFDVSTEELAENIDSSLDEAEVSITTEYSEIEKLESMILSFAVDYVYDWFHNRISNYAENAQAKMKSGLYGIAIACYKDILTFLEDSGFTMKKFPDIGEVLKVKNAVHERISFCYLCADNATLALRHIQQSIECDPGAPLPHLWHAICNRRLEKWNASLKCFTILNTMYQVNEQTCFFSTYEQSRICKLWCLIMYQAQQLIGNVKVAYFPISNYANKTYSEKEATLSMQFLQSYPTYNSVILPDPTTIHIVPTENADTIFDHQKSYQVCGFIQADNVAKYLGDLPKYNNHLTQETTNLQSSADQEFALEKWNVVGLLNSTNYKLSQRPGKEIHEHLEHCLNLVQIGELRAALHHIRSISVDMSILPLLPEEKWSATSDDVHESYVLSLDSAVKAIDVHFKETMAQRRGVDQIKRWLEECEKKHRLKRRLKQRQKSVTSSCKKTPKRKMPLKVKKLRSYTS